MADKKKAVQTEPYIARGAHSPFDATASICSFLEKQTHQTPHAVAIKFHHTSLTYLELDHQANQLANYLSRLNLPPQSSVSIYMKPSLHMIISIVALLKTGCHYIPLDDSYPLDRINFMLKDSHSHFMLTETSILQKSGELCCEIINMDAITSMLNAEPTHFVSRATAHDLAYMIYTSGSTGVPKGVKVSHFAVNNHMLWMQREFDLTGQDTILLKTPLSFDPSIWEIFIPLYTGSPLIIAPAGSHIDPEGIIDLILKHKITIIQLVPAILKLLLNSPRIQECSTLRIVFVGGESLRPEIKHQFFDTLSCQLVNLYGPTEATIDITFHRVTRSATDLSTNIIGNPIDNTNLYVIKENKTLAGISEDGELHIGSYSLAEGYHQRESLTQDHFIDNLFEPEQFKKIYKTGDLVRWLPNKSLEYLGRNNDQVKINGVRVEPKELTLCILQHVEVSDCIVIKKTDSHGHDYLACYLTHQPNHTIPLVAIKERLKETFPNYMLPKVYIPIEKIPLTVNGKVDIKALPEADFKTTTLSTHPKNRLDPIERQLLSLWQIVLETNQISLDDDFFNAGGGSLLALKLIALIQEKYHLTVRIRDIFSYPTVKEQAKLIKGIKNIHRQSTCPSSYVPNPIICLQAKGQKTPLFLIHPIGGTVFWFSHLAKLLGPSRPIYGIQDPSIDLERPILNSIEEMADFYLEHIKKIQPTGPYLIGGASFGATVAVEVSKRLHQANETTSAIIVLDGWGVYPNTILDDNYFRQSMLRQHAELLSDFKRYGLPPPDILFEIQWFRLHLLWKYQLDHIACPLALFKSADLLPAFLEIDAPYNHWENFSNQITTIRVQGNHETMFQEPHVYQLTAALHDYLTQNNL